MHTGQDLSYHLLDNGMSSLPCAFRQHRTQYPSVITWTHWYMQHGCKQTAESLEVDSYHHYLGALLQ